MSATEDQFRAEITKFLSVNRWTKTRFGRTAMNDPNFVFRLYKGRGVSVRTVDRVRAFMDRYTREKYERENAQRKAA